MKQLVYFGKAFQQRKFKIHKKIRSIIGTIETISLLYEKHSTKKIQDPQKNT